MEVEEDKIPQREIRPAAQITRPTQVPAPHIRITIREVGHQRQLFQKMNIINNKILAIKPHLNLVNIRRGWHSNNSISNRARINTIRIGLSTQLTKMKSPHNTMVIFPFPYFIVYRRRKCGDTSILAPY